MNKTKYRSIIIAALMLALALVLSFAVGSLGISRRAAAVEYRPTEIFSAGAGGEVGASSAEEGENSYVQFTFDEDEGVVYYRHDLAVKWYAPVAPADEGEENDGEAEGAAEVRTFANPKQTKYFSMTLSFPELHFGKFTLSFESAEENISKQNKSVNALVFFNDDDGYRVAVRSAAEQPDKDAEGEDDWVPASTLALTEGEDLVITLDEEDCDFGEFSVKIGGQFAGKFTNVGGYYMEYLSSASSSPRNPITFTADKLEEGEDVTQTVLVKELNGQTFELTDAGRVTDNADPALVINEEIHSYMLGKKWSLSYEAIDVCDTSVTITRRYAMLNAPDEDDLYPKPTTSEYSSLTTNTVFMPTSDDQSEKQHVSIYFELDDGRSLKKEEIEAKRVYLTWYAAENSVETLPSAQAYECPVCGYRVNRDAYDELEEDWVCPNPNELEDHAETSKDSFTLTDVDPFDYIIVDRETVAPSYVGVTNEDDVDDYGNPIKKAVASNVAKDLAEEYQRAVDEASKDLSAGSGAYFYLPSVRSLVECSRSDYRNLRFAIYFKKQSAEVGASASSNTGLRYNALRFQIDEEGKYIFKIIVSDASGNAMEYAVDGKVVAVTSSNVWDIDAIPTFHFTAGYNGASIEESGEQTLGYIESTYTIESFDVVALSGYDSEYSLYRFDENGFPANLTQPSYSDLVKNTAQYLHDYEEFFVPIKKYNSSVKEDDEALWARTDNDYHWNPDSALSFIPREVGYYVVQLVVTEARMPGHSVTAYKVIDVRTELDPIPNTTEWIESNIVSVVLFSVSAVLLIAIIVLCVAVPSEKKVEEIDLERLRGNKKK